VIKEIDLYGDGIGKVQYIQHMGDDKTIVNSARVSFGSDCEGSLTERDKKLIKYLIRHKHTSTLEHNIITFKFIVPLFIRSQHHRHRTWSYNEISRRYTDKNLAFYEPSKFRTQHKSNRQASNVEELVNPKIDTFDPACSHPVPVFASDLIVGHHKASLALFDDLLAAGVCREQARGVLPQNLYTEYYGSVNLNNLLKFVELRIHEGAQYEIQKVAMACLEIAEHIWPITIGSYREIRGL